MCINIAMKKEHQLTFIMLISICTSSYSLKNFYGTLNMISDLVILPFFLVVLPFNTDILGTQIFITILMFLLFHWHVPSTFYLITLSKSTLLGNPKYSCSFLTVSTPFWSSLEYFISIPLNVLKKIFIYFIFSSNLQEVQVIWCEMKLDECSTII